jgi:hypothetical protein
MGFSERRFILRPQRNDRRRPPVVLKQDPETGLHIITILLQHNSTVLYNIRMTFKYNQILSELG